ncbi:MAG: VIT domain-containing protein [Lysobacterales bacterium]
MNCRPIRWLRHLNHKDWVLLSLALFFGLTLSMRAVADPLNDVNSGTLLLDLGDTAGALPGPRLSTDVTMEVAGMVAHVTVVQRFSNNAGEFAEGIYLFPLPEDAAVNAMQMRIGKRVIEGEIQEKKRAQQTYAQAASEGKRASLLSQERPNLFKSRVANLAPGEEIAVRISYVQPLVYQSGQFRLRFPMAVTPRFDPLASGVSEQHTTNAINPTTLNIHLKPGFELSRLSSLYHDVTVDQHGGNYEVALTDEVVAAQRDFELVWEPTLKSAPQAALFGETVENESFGLLMVMPPQDEYVHPLPRELILVVDSSGSMFGESMTQAKASLEMALGSLTNADRVNVIDFDNEATALFETPQTADPQSIGLALNFIDGLKADGGTEIGKALTLALAGEPTQGYLRQVVFITDGSVANETELFAMIESQLGESRLFTVGIGPAPNSYFMRKAAQFGRGSYTFIGNTDQVTEQMDLLLGRLEHPALNDLCLFWPGLAESYPSRLPDLYLGEPLMVNVKLSELKGDAEVCGNTPLNSWNEHLDLKKAQSGQGIATLWARSRVASLMDELALGGDPDSIKQDVLTVALDHQLVTRYTSFVAVDKTPVRPQQMSLASSQMAPLASSELALSLPVGGTGAPARIVFGLMLLLIAATMITRLRNDS